MTERENPRRQTNRKAGDPTASPPHTQVSSSWTGSKDRSKREAAYDDAEVEPAKLVGTAEAQLLQIGLNEGQQMATRKSNQPSWSTPPKHRRPHGN